MNWIKQLMIGTMLTIQSVLPSREDKKHKDETELGELEPVRVRDDWEKWVHHDDVTEDEIKDLFPQNPEDMTAEQLEAFRAAEIEVFRRQKEQLDWWRDKERRTADFQEAYLKDADLDQEQIPMEEREGWGDDDDMPEGFIGVNQLTGDREYIRFDDLPEWRNRDE